MITAVTIPKTTGFFIEGRVACPEDYSPCSCEQDASGDLSVVCNEVPIANIQTVFSQTNVRVLASFKITIAPTETSSIPADFLGASRSNELEINCAKSLYNLIIDENAFRSSNSLTKKLFIRGCNLGKQPDFSFSSDFQSLEWFVIDNSKNFNSFKGIPPQSNLYYIDIMNSQGFDNLADDPKIALPAAYATFSYISINWTI